MRGSSYHDDDGGGPHSNHRHYHRHPPEIVATSTIFGRHCRHCGVPSLWWWCPYGCQRPRDRDSPRGHTIGSRMTRRWKDAVATTTVADTWHRMRYHHHHQYVDYCRDGSERLRSVVVNSESSWWKRERWKNRDVVVDEKLLRPPCVSPNDVRRRVGSWSRAPQGGQCSMSHL